MLMDTVEGKIKHPIFDGEIGVRVNFIEPNKGRWTPKPTWSELSVTCEDGTILQKINTLQYSTNDKYKLQLPYYIKDITFPLKITDEIVDILIKNNKEQNTSHEFMYT